MQMQLNRDHVHVSLCGLSVEFKKGVSTYVPPRLIKEVIGLGGTAAEGDAEVEATARAEIARVTTETDSRRPGIEAGIRTMLQRNQRGDFTAGGRPNLRVLFQLTGLDVGVDEMEPIWVEVRKEVE